ncbi:hypothetical protein [Kluyvera ascorbata]|uniref:hypothetical protein n=1 Tax=Kluyvera ascorbata TaxID=51288 RepID=UPI0039F668D5
MNNLLQGAQLEGRGERRCAPPILPSVDVLVLALLLSSAFFLPSVSSYFFLYRFS